MFYLIILGIILYLIIAWAVFRVVAANDFFDEFVGYKIYSFPTATFYFSLFWLIAIPISLIMALLGWILEEIECMGYAYREVAIQKKYEKEKQKKKEGK